MLGFYPVKVLPSKTAILPVNPKFLPRVSRQINLHYLLMLNLCNKCIIFIFLQSEDEKEMVSRTVYCTNIDKKVCFVLYHFCFHFIMVMLIGETSPQICGGKACLGFSLPQTPLMWKPPALGLPFFNVNW